MCEIFDIKSKKVKLHFVGIGGVGMYSLARLSVEEGAVVSGSDLTENRYTRDLKERGCRIFSPHTEGAVDSDTDLVIYSNAIGSDNPELIAAKEHKIGTVSRAEYQGYVMKRYISSIGVCGTHGKSTVTAMLSHIMMLAGESPTTVCGADIDANSPIIIGKNDLFIYEACEYRDSFLKMIPKISVVTSIELDHTDYFHSLERYKESFLHFIEKTENRSVVNIDDENVASLIALLDKDVVTVSTRRDADFVGRIYSFKNDCIIYSLLKKNMLIGNYKLRLNGAFNLSNALLAIAAAREYGIPEERSARALESFRGIPRRLELKGEYNSRRVYYDYAHHPTEIRAGINALKLSNPTLTVVFTPHTYSRTKDLFSDFVAALSLADYIIITDIYAARETPIPGVDSQWLADAIGERAVYAKEDEIILLLDQLTYGAIVVMGAGNNDKIIDTLLKK